MSKLRITAIVVVCILAFIALAFILELGGLEWAKFFGPKRENVRREVFEATKSYNEAKAQDLIRYRMQYMKADTIEKKALATMIRDMYADFDISKLRSVESREFLTKIMKGEDVR